MKSALTRLWNLITKPLTSQWPLWLMILLMMGPHSVPGAWAYVACALAALMRRKWAAWVLFALVLLLTLADQLVQVNYRARLGAETLRLIAETSTREAAEWLTSLRPTRANAIIAASAVGYTALMWILMRFRNAIETRLPTLLRRGILIAAMALTAICFYKCRLLAPIAQIQNDDDIARWDTSDNRPYDVVTNLLFAARCMQVSADEMRQAVATTRALAEEPAPTAVFNHDSLTIVLVIGESHIRAHSSLYGYPLATNPHMQAEADAERLTVFTNAVAPFDQTTPVLKNMLCTNSIGLHEPWNRSAYLPALMAHAGYAVNLFDNQRVSYRNSGATFALNAFLYDPYMTEHVYTTLNDSIFAYDGQLVDHLARRRDAVASRSALTIIHLLGQHFNADLRYPAEQAHFTADSLRWRSEHWLDDEARHEIAHYDNACLYGDSVLAQIINLYRSREAVVIYLSDHGEEIYDYRPHTGRYLNPTDITPEFAHTHFDVPMFVWVSDSYSRRHPDLVAALPEAARKPFPTDLLPHLLLRLAGVATPHYRAALDPLSPQYRCPPRHVAGQDYDNIIK